MSPWTLEDSTSAFNDAWPERQLERQQLFAIVDQIVTCAPQSFQPLMRATCVGDGPTWSANAATFGSGDVGYIATYWGMTSLLDGSLGLWEASEQQLRLQFRDINSQFSAEGNTIPDGGFTLRHHGQLHDEEWSDPTFWATAMLGVVCLQSATDQALNLSRIQRALKKAPENVREHRKSKILGAHGFVLAHEFAHLLLGHGPRWDDEVTSLSNQLADSLLAGHPQFTNSELRSDALAAFIVGRQIADVHATNRIGRAAFRIQMLAGCSIALSSLQLLEGGSLSPTDPHPPLSTRIEAVNNVVISDLNDLMTACWEGATTYERDILTRLGTTSVQQVRDIQWLNTKFLNALISGL